MCLVVANAEQALRRMDADVAADTTDASTGSRPGGGVHVCRLFTIDGVVEVPKSFGKQAALIGRKHDLILAVAAT